MRPDKGIRNDDIRDKLGATPIQEKLVQNRLRWFGHIQRKDLMRYQYAVVF
jgi:hypothetical protein